MTLHCAHEHTHTYKYIYRVSQEECARIQESVPYVKLYRYILNEGITMCLEIKYYNISVRQHNLIIFIYSVVIVWLHVSTKD